jgi:transcriptional regulator with XRE-family HTH domain
MKLSAYIDEQDLTRANVAAELNISVSYLSRLERGERNPSGSLIRKIESFSSGLVNFSDFFSSQAA